MERNDEDEDGKEDRWEMNGTLRTSSSMRKKKQKALTGLTGGWLVGERL